MDAWNSHATDSPGLCGFSACNSNMPQSGHLQETTPNVSFSFSPLMPCLMAVIGFHEVGSDAAPVSH